MAQSKGEMVFNETAKGVARGGILGSIGGFFTGGVVGGLMGALNPAGIALGIIGGAAAVIGAGTLIGTVGLVAALALPVLGAAGGALTGLGIGTGVGVGVFGAKGAMAGNRKAGEQEEVYQEQKASYRAARQNSVNNARASAAEQYTAVGYQNGFQEGAQVGAQAVVNRILQARQAQMEGSFVERYASGKKNSITPEGVRESQLHAGSQEPQV